MSNVLAPFGFSEAYRIGGAPNYQQAKAKIASANTTQIFRGDPVVQLATGYITQATPGTTQIAGIFVGCEYQSIAQKKPVWSPYWPGNGDANGDITAWVINDPTAVFRAQTNGYSSLPAPFAAVGSNVNFAFSTSGANGTANNGNTATGNSTAVLDLNTVAVTNTLPFRIIDLVTDPPGSNGADTTTAYNWLYVKFNYTDYNSLVGI